MLIYCRPTAILGLFLIGCTPSPTSEVALHLAGDAQRDWSQVMNYRAQSCYGVCFRADGTFQRYVQNSKGARTCYGDYEGNKWRLLPDGTLDKGGIIYDVAYSSEDVLVLRNKIGPGILTYLKAQDQQTQCHPDTSGAAFRM